MEQIFVKPAHAGLIVRHPEKLSHILSEEGEWVRRSTQWDRYIKVGDVIQCEPEKSTSKKGDK
jgi:hypothetical protein